MTNKILINKLQEEMKKKHWSGRRLSEAANLSYNAVHYILSGKNKSTKFEVVKAIADTLGVSPFYLLEKDYNEEGRFAKAKLPTPETDNIPYDGELYRQIMVTVEELLNAKGDVATQKVEYFTKYIYSQIKKNNKDVKDIKLYAEGIIDYALNIS